MTEPVLPRPPDLPELDGRSGPSPAEQLVELSTLTGGLAHEIRNPLSTLRVNLQLLDEDWRQIEQPSEGRSSDSCDVARRSRRRIATLLREADHLERILQDFLQYVGRRELEATPTDLGGLLDDLVEFYQPQAESGRIELRLSHAPQPMVCRIDARLMKQAILNLLINAQEAMPQDGQILIQVRPHGERSARIDVIDTGPGVPADRLEKIFDAYYSTKKGGSGLGLATARRIIRQHGGELHVHSCPPHGTCFSILLPCEG